MASFMKKVLHSGSAKSPHDLVDRAASSAAKITDTASERQQEELAKYLAMMKVRPPAPVRNSQHPHRQLSMPACIQTWQCMRHAASRSA